MHSSLCETNLPSNTNIDSQFLLLIQKASMCRNSDGCSVSAGVARWGENVEALRGAKKTRIHPIKFYGFAELSTLSGFEEGKLCRHICTFVATKTFTMSRIFSDLPVI